MGNMTLFIVGIAVLSAGTYLMRPWRSKARQPAGALRTFSGAIVGCGNGIAVFSGAGNHVL
ncbi:Uncharacterised protein [Citrobacter koseri]|nr:Uncharacterised protein [Citrobacter koseri]